MQNLLVNNFGLWHAWLVDQVLANFDRREIYICQAISASFPSKILPKYPWLRVDIDLF